MIRRRFLVALAGLVAAPKAVAEMLAAKPKRHLSVEQVRNKLMVWMPATEQQLDEYGDLRRLIDESLVYPPPSPIKSPDEFDRVVLAPDSKHYLKQIFTDA